MVCFVLLGLLLWSLGVLWYRKSHYCDTVKISACLGRYDLRLNGWHWRYIRQFGNVIMVFLGFLWVQELLFAIVFKPAAWASGLPVWTTCEYVAKTECPSSSSSYLCLNVFDDVCTLLMTKYWTPILVGYKDMGGRYVVFGLVVVV